MTLFQNLDMSDKLFLMIFTGICFILDIQGYISSDGVGSSNLFILFIAILFTVVSYFLVGLLIVGLAKLLFDKK